MTTLETHPTRPELLIAGTDDGFGIFWDRRKLDTPFRIEICHQHAVRALKLHSASPQYIYTAGDDNVVKCWDFYHGQNPCESVEFVRHTGVTASQNLVPFSPLGTTFKRLGGLYAQQLTSGSLPWNALTIHAESDTLVAGSDAQSIVIVQQASKWKQ